MAVGMFLKLDGVEGESRDAKHKGEIDVESFSFGASNQGSPGGGGGAGKVAVHDFSFTAEVSKASPKLFLACASGQHFKEAILTVRKAGGQQQDFLKITFSDVTVSGFQEGGAGGADLPRDQATMGFQKIQVSYTGQRFDGMPDTPITVGWDLKKNTKF